MVQRNIEKVRNLTTSQLLAARAERLQQSIAKRTATESHVREQRERRQAIRVMVKVRVRVRVLVKVRVREPKR